MAKLPSFPAFAVWCMGTVHHMKKLLGMCLPAFFALTSHAQLQLADSLKRALDSEKNRATRVDLLNGIAYAYYDYDDSLAMVYAVKALELAEDADNSKGLKYAHTLVGIGYYSQGNYKEALLHFRKSDHIEVAGASPEASYNSMMMGKILFEQARDDSALYCFRKALTLATRGGTTRRLSSIYRNIAQLYLTEWNHDSAYHYLVKADEVTKDLTDSDYIEAEVNSLWGTYYEDKLDYKRSAEYFERMCALSKQGGDNYHLIKCYLNKSELSYRKGEFAESLLHGFDALKVTERYAYPPQLTDTYLQLGNTYTALSQHDLASRYLFEGLATAEKYGLPRKVASASSSIAWLYYIRKEHGLALDFINRAQAIRDTIRDVRGIGNCYNVRGLIYYNQKDYARALTEFRAAEGAWASIGHEDGVSSAIFNASLVFAEQGQLARALELQMKSIEVDLKTQNKENLAISYNNIGSLLVRMNRLGEALKYLSDAGQFARESGARLQLLYNYEIMARYYEAKENYREANGYLKRSKALADSIYSTNSSVRLAEMQALYQVEQKDREIEILSQRQALNEKEIELQRAQISRQYILVASIGGGFGLSLIILFMVVRFNRRIKRANRSITEQKEEIQAQSEELMDANTLLTRLNREITEQKEEIQAQTEELAEANEAIYRTNQTLEEAVQQRTSELRQAYQELDTFFYRSSHDFRRPITTFLGLAEVAKVTIKDQNALDLFDKVKATATSLDKMLFKLQSISDLGGQQMIHKEVALKELIEEIIRTHAESLSARNIQVKLEYQLKQPLISYPALVKIIIENLVENAIEFAGVESPFVRIGVVDNHGQVVVDIEDNGQGIDIDFQSRIFDMYYRANERSKGSGLGLYIVKKAVERLGGSISFHSVRHQGSKFTVRLTRKTEVTK